jgi:hypothetical protein
MHPRYPQGICAPLAEYPGSTRKKTGISINMQIDLIGFLTFFFIQSCNSLLPHLGLRLNMAENERVAEYQRISKC